MSGRQLFKPALYNTTFLSTPTLRQKPVQQAFHRSIPSTLQPIAQSNISNSTRNMSSSASADFPPSEIRSILEEVTTLLKDRNETVSVAETAAGGLISSSILSTPGASKIYKGGLTLYTLPSRIAYAGWTQQSIEHYKGPTPDIVAGLAKHTRQQLGSTYTISESGTAGPTGGQTPNRTPGYVALAVDSERGCFTRELNTDLGTDRTANMIRFVVEALNLLKEVIEGKAKL